MLDQLSVAAVAVARLVPGKVVESMFMDGLEANALVAGRVFGGAGT